MKREVAQVGDGPPSAPTRARGLPDAHGTYSTYVNHGCRCRPCREAQHSYYLVHRDRVIATAAAWNRAHKGNSD